MIIKNYFIKINLTVKRSEIINNLKICNNYNISKHLSLNTPKGDNINQNVLHDTNTYIWAAINMSQYEYNYKHCPLV